MTRDAWGNVTQIRVQGSSDTSSSTPTAWTDGITLGTYTYSGENGLREKMEYGNGCYVTYEYDLYGRTTRVRHWDASDTLTGQERFYYDGNSNVSRMEHLDGTGTVLETYIYEYDSLGRLIRSQLEDSEAVRLQTEHIYDASNRLSRQNYYIGGVDFRQEFVYNDNDGSLTSMTTANGDTLTYGYDGIKRLQSVTASNGDGNLYTKSFTYAPYASTGSRSTSQVSNMNYALPNRNVGFAYSYDSLGNISGYSYGNHAVTYGYDDLGQLITATENGVTTTYTYDTAGNIRQVKQGNTVTGTYTYGNSDWRDLLTAYNGQPIAYEGQIFNGSTVSGTPVSGNPISYYNGTRWEFDWAEGRQLVTATTAPDDNTELSIDYTYDLNGLRTGKTVTTRTYSTHTHNYTNTVVAPTCTTDGYTLHECACGDSYQDSTVSKLGHSWVETGRDSMYIYSRCTRCGATRKTSVITVPIDPDPPVSEYSLGDDPEPSAAPTGTERTLISTVTEHHDYIYASGQLLRETITTTAADGTVTVEVLDFSYNATGNPYALTYTDSANTSTTYYYITNLQGDVIYLASANGTIAAEYTYDAYGKITTATGSMAEINPLRYRGYYYDRESGFYYLQSRYYDPAVCRFVNADGLASTGQGFLGQNMFAYCLNSPVNYVDDSGVQADTYQTDDPRESEDAPVQYYPSADEAARAFGRKYFDKAKFAKKEYGAAIFKTTVDGNVCYYYIAVDPGTDHNVDINTPPLNTGDQLAGTVHMHLDFIPDALHVSKYDFAQARGQHHEGNTEFIVYFITPDKDMYAFDYSDGYQYYIGTIYSAKPKRGKHSATLTCNMIC